MLLAAALTCSGALAQELTSDTFSVGMISVKTNYLNPLWALERDFQSLHSLMYESLIRLNDNYEPEPYIATKWEASNNCKNWTFWLRDDVYFSDGTKLTAYDAAATINEIIRLAKDETAENHGVYASMRYVISSAQANDALTLVVNAARPYYGVIYAMNFPILKASEVQFEYPIGSGPYLAESFYPANYLYLSYNDRWWGEEPRVKNINAFFSATNRDLTADYEYNRVDAIVTRSVTTAQYRGGVTSVNIDYRTRQLETLLMNMNSYELQDIRVRYAIRYALDPDALSNNAYYGMTSRTDTPFPRGTWMYYDPSGDDGEDYFAYNPEKANRLLDEAGWIDTNGDGVRDMIRDAKSVALSLRLWVYEEAENSVRVETANQIRDQLAKVGITVRVYLVSFALAKERLQAGNFDLCLAAYQMDSVPDPGFLLYGPNTGNYGRYKNAEMNSLITDLRKCDNKNDYQRKLREIQSLFAKECPFICLYYRGGAVLSRRLYTNVRDIREPEVLKGIEAIGMD